jgi:nicotinamidase/pyrazinamidase
MAEKSRAAVIVVDFQADFTEVHSGALAVPGTREDYVELVVRETENFRKQGLTIIATRDYHPSDHVSFYTNHPGKKPMDIIQIAGRRQILWPEHCVQGRSGAEILLPEALIDHVITTANRPEFESYSAFRDDGGQETGLKKLLDDLGANNLIVYGLATDYCVKETVIHALEQNYDVTLMMRLSRGITPETTQKAVAAMKAAGATIQE